MNNIQDRTCVYSVFICQRQRYNLTKYLCCTSQTWRNQSSVTSQNSQSLILVWRTPGQSAS